MDSFASDIVKRHPHVAILAATVYIAAVAFLVAHNLHEALQPGYDYVFARRLCEYVETCLRTPGKSREERLTHALELFHSVFTRAGIVHVSIHTPEAEKSKSLIILKEHVYPPIPAEQQSCYLVRLMEEEGVGGKVFSDLMVRYVPRVFFPFGRMVTLPLGRRRVALSMDFPHAVKFNYKTDGAAGSTISGFEITEEAPDPYAFKIPAEKVALFRSCLSVPIKDIAVDRCVGVLNYDFTRTDPLNKADITMAAVFGLLLSELLPRQREAGAA